MQADIPTSINRRYCASQESKGFLRNAFSTAANAAAPDGMKHFLRKKNKQSYFQTIV
jgi:hypothetical protein